MTIDEAIVATLIVWAVVGPCLAYVLGRSHECDEWLRAPR